MLTSCQQFTRKASLSTETDSSSFATLAAKKEFIYRYISSELEFEDIEFRVWYVDNSGGMIPGPSDYRIEVLARIDSSHLDRWLAKVNESKMSNLAWPYSLNPEDMGCHPEIIKVYQSQSRTKTVGLHKGNSCIIAFSSLLKYNDKCQIANKPVKCIPH
ncbi:MAG: hypothetical protein AAFY57_13735 [Cyanobacteria bacterium J06642_2]